MRQTRLSIIYYFLFVTTAHLVALTMLWMSHSTALALPLASASPSITATLLSAAPQSLHKQMQQQAIHIKRPSTSALIQKKITRTAVRPTPSAVSAATQSLAAPPNRTATLTNTLTSDTSSPPRSVQHLDCRIAQPRYPVLSRQREESGVALIKMIVSAYGVIEQATVIQSSGSNRLDYAARTAALTSTCRPYRLNGQPLRAAVNLRFKFSLQD